MKWIEAVFQTTSTELDSLAGRLTELGAEGLVIEDEADFRAFLEQNRQYWDYVDEELERKFAGVSRIKLYVPDDDAGRAALSRITEGVGKEPACAVVDDADWENNWKQYYKPIEVGEKLIIVPSWEAVPESTRLPLRLDPGLIFGTGSHATTRMCLEALENYAAPGKAVLDLGCGSGILGIGALLLGCSSVFGCDIDPMAPKIALENAALNGIGEAGFRIFAGDIIADASLRAMLRGPHDIVLANIVADVIIPLAPHAREFCASGGVFICSGIIEGRQSEVRAAVEKAGFSVVRHIFADDWHCFVAA